MFFQDKHKAATAIVSKRGPKGGPHTMSPTEMKPEVVMDEGGEVDGRHLAAQEMIAAHKEGSAHKLMQAMMNFIDLHNSAPQVPAQPEREEG